VFTVLEESLSRTVALNPGLNVFTITSVDEAKNESSPSNSVRVTYDEASGLYISSPFKSNDQFHLNLTRNASEVTLRIYDLAGEVVVVISSSNSSSNYAFTWNGLNGDGEEVKKGPLVAVAEIRYTDDSTDIYREIFLYDTSN
jgi:flagellar hook assembly protein FlgD